MADLSNVDVRTVQRYLNKGQLSREDYEAHIAALPDLEGEADFVDYGAQFQREEAQRQAEQARAEQAQVAAAPAAPVAPPAVATAYVPPLHHAPPATVAPASVAPSAMASVPQAPSTYPMHSTGSGQGTGSDQGSDGSSS